MPKDRDAVFIQSFTVRRLGRVISTLRVLKSLSGVLLPGWVVLFLTRLRSTAMRVGGIIAQLGGSLMIFVV
ncbi:MAG: hypothetical protein WCB12_07515 [Bryobacteraceae bacterium]